MSPRYVYFYLMKEDPEPVRAAAPRHATYWHELALTDYLGGPFVDRTGGLITFSTEDLEEAELAVAGDPFVREELLTFRWLRRWILDTDPS